MDLLNAPARALRAAAVALCCSGLVASGAAAAPTPHIAKVRCWPGSTCDKSSLTVHVGGTLRITGSRFARNMVVFFKGHRPLNRRAARAPIRRRSRGAVTVTVPPGAHSGYVVLAILHGPRSNKAGPVRVLARVAAAPRQPLAAAPISTPAGASPFDGTGMWIWYLSKSSAGDPARIAATAAQYHVSTVFIKSGDGTSAWPQFSPQLVSDLKSRGLHVCGWQYLYGKDPNAEADVSAGAVRTGADCFVIDAETQYEGRYSQAQAYVNRLRAQVGPGYPIGLAGFPYVDYHPAYPYSVFLGPGAAQFNVPQMYWKAIGTTVDNVYSHTYVHNRIYGRAIFPLGQLYDHPAPAQVTRFRQLAVAYGATGVSWWDWQEADPQGWQAIADPLQPLAGFVPQAGYPPLARGAKGDEVVWAQEELAAGGHPVPVTGSYDVATEQAVAAFQASAGLGPTGKLDDPTWQALLRNPPAPADWSAGGPSATAKARAASTGGRARRARLRSRRCGGRSRRRASAGAAVSARTARSGELER